MLKKRIKTILAIVLIVVIAMSISACNKNSGGGENGGGESSGGSGDTKDDIAQVMAEIQDNMNAAKSMTYNLVMDMEMEVMGMDFPTKTNLDIDMIVDPIQMKMVGTMDMGEMGEYDMNMYIVPEGDQLATYTGMEVDGNMDWMKTNVEMSASEVAQYNAAQSLEVYLKNAENFEEVGKEFINDRETTKFQGIITSDSMVEVLNASGMASQLETSGTELTEETIKAMGDLPITFWVDMKEKMVVKYSMDMTGALTNLMEYQAEQEEDSEDVLGMIEFKKLVIDATITGINNVDSIEVPEEAISEAETL